MYRFCKLNKKEIFIPEWMTVGWVFGIVPFYIYLIIGIFSLAFVRDIRKDDHISTKIVLGIGRILEVGVGLFMCFGVFMFLIDLIGII